MKGKYIALIVAGGLMIGGAIMGVAAISSYGFNLDKFFSTNSKDAMNMEERTVSISETIRNIKVEDTAIKVVPALGDETTVDVYETKNWKYNVQMVGDTLSVKGDDKNSWVDRIFNIGEGPHVVINLAQTDFDDIYINNSSDSIKVEKGFNFKTADLSSGSGSVRFSGNVEGKASLVSGSGSVKVNESETGELLAKSGSGSVVATDVKCADFTLQSGSGSVNVEKLQGNKGYLKSGSGSTKAIDVKADSLTIENASGSINLENAEIAGDVDLHDGSGSIRAINLKAGNIKAKGSSGSAHFTDTVSEDAFYVENGSGSVTLEACDGNDISLKSSSGSVHASVLSAKEIDASSNSGSVRIPEFTGGEKNGTLYAHSGSGLVKIEYV